MDILLKSIIINGDNNNDVNNKLSNIMKEEGLHTRITLVVSTAIKTTRVLPALLSPPPSSFIESGTRTEEKEKLNNINHHMK